MKILVFYAGNAVIAFVYKNYNSNLYNNQDSISFGQYKQRKSMNSLIFYKKSKGGRDNEFF